MIQYIRSPKGFPVNIKRLYATGLKPVPDLLLRQIQGCCLSGYIPEPHGIQINPLIVLQQYF